MDREENCVINRIAFEVYDFEDEELYVKRKEDGVKECMNLDKSAPAEVGENRNAKRKECETGAIPKKSKMDEIGESSQRTESSSRPKMNLDWLMDDPFRVFFEETTHKPYCDVLRAWKNLDRESFTMYENISKYRVAEARQFLIDNSLPQMVKDPKDLLREELLSSYGGDNTDFDMVVNTTWANMSCADHESYKRKFDQRLSVIDMALKAGPKVRGSHEK